LTDNLTRHATKLRPMARHPDPHRIDIARRAAALARLVSAGEPRDRAAAWIRRWEASRTGPRGRADWEGFEEWLARERSGRRDP
jgi:hypothetical protein